MRIDQRVEGVDNSGALELDGGDLDDLVVFGFHTRRFQVQGYIRLAHQSSLALTEALFMSGHFEEIKRLQRLFVRLGSVRA